MISTSSEGTLISEDKKVIIVKVEFYRDTGKWDDALKFTIPYTENTFTNQEALRKEISKSHMYTKSDALIPWVYTKDNNTCLLVSRIIRPGNRGL